MIHLDLARAHIAMRLEEATSYRVARAQQRQARAGSKRPAERRRFHYVAR
jgi:hypothetical protein